MSLIIQVIMLLVTFLGSGVRNIIGLQVQREGGRAQKFSPLKAVSFERLAYRPDAENRKIRYSILWNSYTVTLIVIRRFGCGAWPRSNLPARGCIDGLHRERGPQAKPTTKLSFRFNPSY